MPIDNKVVDQEATMIRIPVVLQVAAVAASQADIEQAEFRAPYSGEIVSVHVHILAITDGDDSARIDVKKGTTSVLSAAINPTQDTVMAGTLKTDGTEEFVAGDKIGLFATTGGGDALTKVSATIVIRPYTGGRATRPSV